MSGRFLGLLVIIIVTVIGYGWWLRLTKGVRAVGQAEAVVIVSGDRTGCAVRRGDAKPRRGVSCRDVGTYLQNELRLARGTAVGIRVVGKISPEQVAAVSSDLSTHGYQVVGVLRAGLATRSARASSPHTASH
jgi:hypothetical protein